MISGCGPVYHGHHVKLYDAIGQRDAGSGKRAVLVVRYSPDKLPIGVSADERAHVLLYLLRDRSRTLCRLSLLTDAPGRALELVRAFSSCLEM